MAIRYKHLRLDEAKLNKARLLLGLNTEEATIDAALDFVLAEESLLRVWT